MLKITYTPLSNNQQNYHSQSEVKLFKMKMENGEAKQTGLRILAQCLFSTMTRQFLECGGETLSLI